LRYFLHAVNPHRSGLGNGLVTPIFLGISRQWRGVTQPLGRNLPLIVDEGPVPPDNGS
jgi:hypothetical protein